MKQLSNKDFTGYSVSHDTMQLFDVTESVLNFLESVAKKCDIVNIVKQYKKEYLELKGDIEDEFDLSDSNYEQLTWLLNEQLWTLMNNIAPTKCYFGSHEGDGADYGFWQSMDDYLN